jgi:hypothetical protein
MLTPPIRTKPDAVIKVSFVRATFIPEYRPTCGLLPIT